MRHLRRLLPYLRRHRRDYLLGMVLLLPATACGAAVPWLVRTLFQRLEHGGTRTDVLYCASAVLGTALFRALFIFASRYLILAASRRIEFDLRNDLYAHLETLSGRWYDTNAAGEITSRAINDLEGVRMMIGIGIMAIVSTGLLFLVSLGIMIGTSPMLAALCALPLVGVSIVMAWTGGKMHDLSADVQA